MGVGLSAEGGSIGITQAQDAFCNLSGSNEVLTAVSISLYRVGLHRAVPNST
jgi:hypothetical protein